MTAAAVIAVSAAFGAGFCAGVRWAWTRFTAEVVAGMRTEVFEALERSLAKAEDREASQVP